MIAVMLNVTFGCYLLSGQWRCIPKLASETTTTTKEEEEEESRKRQRKKINQRKRKRKKENMTYRRLFCKSSLKKKKKEGERESEVGVAGEWLFNRHHDDSPMCADFWILLLIAIVIVGFLFFIIGRFSPYEWIKVPGEKDQRGARNAFSLRNSYLFVLSSLTWQGRASILSTCKVGLKYVTWQGGPWFTSPTR